MIEGVEGVDLRLDLRTRTMLVCGVLAFAIGISSLFRARVRRVHVLFALVAADLGLWYASQSLLGLYNAPIWEAFVGAGAVLLPLATAGLFEGIVPRPQGGPSPLLRGVAVLTIPLGYLAVGPQRDQTWAGAVVFVYVFAVFAVGLFALGQRGRNSPSRSVQGRVRFLVLIGSLAAVTSLAEFALFLGIWVPPIGAALSVVFLFVLADSLRHERLVDMYEMLIRLIVTTAAVAAIATLFYVLINYVGRFETMYVIFALGSIVVLFVLEPLRRSVEELVQKWVLRDRFDLEASLAELRNALARTVQIEPASQAVVDAFERSRRVTLAVVYFREPAGREFQRIAGIGEGIPEHLEVATLQPLLEMLGTGPVVMEALERANQDEGAKRVLACQPLLGSLKQATFLLVPGGQGEALGLMAVADERMRDAFSPEEVQLLNGVASQLAAVALNSETYRRLQEQERLALLGQMSAGLAHEIRNPLGAIKGAAQLLAESPLAKDKDAEFLGVILDEVERLNRVVGSVLELSRGDGTQGSCDAVHVLRKTHQLLSSEWGNDVELDVECEHQELWMSMDADSLKQVLMNLFQNGVQAMGGRGRLRVSLGATVRAGGGSWVELRVSDSGPGMSGAVLQKAFLPFFTTKERGTGLGLAVSKRIVSSAGGALEVSSREGAGTTFVLSVPAFNRSASAL